MATDAFAFSTWTCAASRSLDAFCSVQHFQSSRPMVQIGTRDSQHQTRLEQALSIFLSLCCAGHLCQSSRWRQELDPHPIRLRIQGLLRYGSTARSCGRMAWPVHIRRRKTLVKHFLLFQSAHAVAKLCAGLQVTSCRPRQRHTWGF